MQQKVIPTTVKGFIIGLIMIVISIIASFMELQANGYFQWLGYGIFLVGVILSISQYGKQINYNSTFGNYFAHGFKVSALVTLMMIVFLVIFMTVFPEFKDKAMEEAKKGMAEKNMSEDQVEQALNMTKKFFMVFLIGGALLGYLIVGAIASVIGAAITKKDPHPLEDIN
jgi:predicted membrane channel-forming protein YqfA (hemolysin III family)